MQVNDILLVVEVVMLVMRTMDKQLFMEEVE